MTLHVSFQNNFFTFFFVFLTVGYNFINLNLSHYNLRLKKWKLKRNSLLKKLSIE